MTVEDMQQEVVGKRVEDKVNELWVEDKVNELRVAGTNAMGMLPDKVKKQDMVEVEGDMLMAEAGRQWLVVVHRLGFDMSESQKIQGESSTLVGGVEVQLTPLC